MPLGVAAELLRAACVAASAEIVLALVSTGGGTLLSSELAAAAGEGGGNGRGPLAAAFFLFSSLRLLASALAGAAVSCVGGGGSGAGAGGCSGEKQRKGGRREFTADPPPPSSAMSRTPSVPSMTEGRSGRVSISSATSFALGDGVGGRSRRGDDRRTVSADSEAPILMTATAEAAWIVPSGALGGAFYALTTGGVFGETMRKYLLGE